MTLVDLFSTLKMGQGNFGHAGIPGHRGGSAPKSGSGGGRAVESKGQLSGILKKAGFSAAKKQTQAGKVKGSRPYVQAGYEIEITQGPGGNSAFIKVVTTTRRTKGELPKLEEIKTVLENEGFKVKDTNWEGGGLDVR